MEYGPRFLRAPDGRRYWCRIHPGTGRGNWLAFEPLGAGAVLYAPIPRTRTLLGLDAEDLVEFWKQAVGRG
jgi:hypothetical protein